MYLIILLFAKFVFNAFVHDNYFNILDSSIFHFHTFKLYGKSYRKSIGFAKEINIYLDSKSFDSLVYSIVTQDDEIHMLCKVDKHGVVTHYISFYSSFLLSCNLSDILLKSVRWFYLNDSKISLNFDGFVLFSKKFYIELASLPDNIRESYEDYDTIIPHTPYLKNEQSMLIELKYDIDLYKFNSMYICESIRNRCHFEEIKNFYAKLDFLNSTVVFNEKYLEINSPNGVLISKTIGLCYSLNENSLCSFTSPIKAIRLSHPISLSNCEIKWEILSSFILSYSVFQIINKLEKLLLLSCTRPSNCIIFQNKYNSIISADWELWKFDKDTRNSKDIFFTFLIYNGDFNDIFDSSYFSLNFDFICSQQPESVDLYPEIPETLKDIVETNYTTRKYLSSTIFKRKKIRKSEISLVLFSCLGVILIISTAITIFLIIKSKRKNLAIIQNAINNELL